MKKYITLNAFNRVTCVFGEEFQPEGAVYIPISDEMFTQVWSTNNCTDFIMEGDTLIYSPLVYEKTTQEIIAEFTVAIQNRLDDFAKTRGYDNILSACTYVTSVVPKFAQEGQYCVQARDLTWAGCYAIMGAVLQGQRPMPTLEEIMSELPPLEWES